MGADLQREARHEEIHHTESRSTRKEHREDERRHNGWISVWVWFIPNPCAIVCLWIIKINQNPSSIHDIMRAHSTSCCSGLWWSKNISFRMDCAHTWDCTYNSSSAPSLYLCTCACTVQLFCNWVFPLDICWQKHKISWHQHSKPIGGAAQYKIPECEKH